MDVKPNECLIESISMNVSAHECDCTREPERDLDGERERET